MYTKYLYFLICVFSLLSGSAISQVGINTTDPRKELEVGGDMKISNTISITQINSQKDNDDSTFLIQDSNNFVQILNVNNPKGSALGYIQEYVITNPNLDWVLDFDTGVDATQYVLNTISANFNRELTMSSNSNSSIPYTAAFIKNGTWHIIADYPSASNQNSATPGSWTITTLIYSKDLSKQLGTVNIPMSGNTTGSATSPIIN